MRFGALLLFCVGGPATAFAASPLSTLPTKPVSRLAQSQMVCCRTNFSNITCTSQNTTWTTKDSCDKVGAEGSDGKNTCSDQTCGH